MYSNSERYINFSFYETQKFIVLLIPIKLNTVNFNYKVLVSEQNIKYRVIYFWVKSQKKKYGSFRKLCSFKVIYDFG
ncbi:hypothetical protein C4X99_11320 [Leptospira interrogans serovar Geyaweera]|nr:hypothetical protein C4X99_11320 [Leptospira interrogans serovar Geyaweera]